MRRAPLITGLAAALGVVGLRAAARALVRAALWDMAA
jgi:hypothetical protein